MKDVSWEVGYTYGETVNANNERGVDVIRFQNALDAVEDTAGIVNGQAGQVVCRVQLLTAQGIAIEDPLTGAFYDPNDPIITDCVPQSVFGVDMRQDGFNPAAEAYFNATIQVTHTNVQQDFLAFASGDLWDLSGAGRIGFAAGYEYRRVRRGGRAGRWNCRPPAVPQYGTRLWVCYIRRQRVVC